MANCNGQTKRHTCIECDVPQQARNHYFTGKFMAERDFTDEQRYHMGKVRRHNQRLHGWGTVCGLKVKQHPNLNSECQKQYVLIEPGTAIDCCGREILVPRQEYFDFRARFLEKWRALHLEADAGAEPGDDDGPHTLQVCVRYVECPTEEVPALFDECGCDDTACQPNRILESYDFDLRLDAETESEELAGVRLAWESTINAAHTYRFAVDEAHDILYVLMRSNPPAVVAFSTVNGGFLLSYTLANDSQALDIALSPDGMHLYVAQAPTTGTGWNLVVLPIDDGTAVSINVNSTTSAANVRLAVASSGRPTRCTQAPGNSMRGTNLQVEVTLRPSH